VYILSGNLFNSTKTISIFECITKQKSKMGILENIIVDKQREVLLKKGIISVSQ